MAVTFLHFLSILSDTLPNNRVDAKNLVASDHINEYCADTHDQAYAALMVKAEVQNKDILAANYDTERTTLKDNYLECTDAYQAWADSKYGSEVTVPASYQQLFDNYDDQVTAQDVKKAKLLDAYVLKPLSINAQGLYQPMAGKVTMPPLLASLIMSLLVR